MQEFDDIYDKEITKRYGKHENNRLSRRKNRKQSMGAGRPFKLDLRDRFVMLLVYYSLYTPTLWLVFYLIWIKVTFAETFKR